MLTMERERETGVTSRNRPLLPPRDQRHDDRLKRDGGVTCPLPLTLVVAERKRTMR